MSQPMAIILVLIGCSLAFQLLHDYAGLRVLPACDLGQFTLGIHVCRFPGAVPDEQNAEGLPAYTEVNIGLLLFSLRFMHMGSVPTLND